MPRARQDGLLEEAVGEELLLYDRDSHIAHCLSPIAACVWRHCDGEHDLTGLAKLAGTSDSLVADALHELREKDLLAAEPELTPSTVLGVSRREAIGRAARYGAAAAAGSMIVSATAATPAMAQSGEEKGGVAFCCECLKVANKPCACSQIKRSKNENKLEAEAEDKANCKTFCAGETVLCANLEASIVHYNQTCQTASNKCA
ncbi:MAG TPA: hypothetical protein VK680_13965 [Solirubrobacteraceae bacterium]|nr:hypothetical protein [Solirubrobacteraceae bacterium]